MYSVQRWPIALAAAALFLTGCRQVTLGSPVSDRTLTYTCDLFRRPQVRTDADRAILVSNYSTVVRHAERNYHDLEEQRLREAYEAEDYDQLEQLVVDYLCAHGDDL